MKRSTLVLALAMTLSVGGIAGAQDFEGASKVIGQVKEYKPEVSPPGQEVKPKADPANTTTLERIKV